MTVSPADLSAAGSSRVIAVGADLDDRCDMRPTRSPGQGAKAISRASLAGVYAKSGLAVSGIVVTGLPGRLQRDQTGRYR